VNCDATKVIGTTFLSWVEAEVEDMEGQDTEEESRKRKRHSSK